MREIKNLSLYFEELLSPLDCEPETRAYIAGIFAKYRFADDDLSKDSLTLRFMQAKEKQDFYGFQNIGDWIFFSNVLAIKHLNNASIDYYQTLAANSYYSCFRLINKKWKLFEQLADDFVKLEAETEKLIHSKIIK